MTILHLLTSLIALNLIQSKHFLVETENKMAARQINAVTPDLPKKAKEEYKSPPDDIGAVRYI